MSPSKKFNIVTTMIGISMVVYQWVSTQFMFTSPTEHINIHLAFVLALVFLKTLHGKARGQIMVPIRLLLILLSLICTVYVHYWAEFLEFQPGTLRTSDLIIGVILIGLILEATRASFGMVLPIFTLLCIAYGIAGHYLPGGLGGMQLPLSRVVSKLAMGMNDGVYGQILAVSANYLFLFVLFGSVLGASGATEFFRQVGNLLATKTKAGPAFAAVTSSALVGMCTGSAVANVATTGVFTIPLMKKAGYRPEQAGAIEAAASTGGQIMPPIMSAAALIMSGFTDIPYLEIITAATVPAILYYVGLIFYTHLQAHKLDLAPPSKANRVDGKQMLASAPSFFIPLALLIFLLIERYSPMFCVAWSLAAIVVISVGISVFVKELRRPLRVWADGIRDGAILGAQIGVTCALLGIVLAVFSFTGLGMKLPGIVEVLCGGNLFLALIMVALIALVLGCGMPTGPVYVLVAIVAAPVLAKMGLPLLQTHLFVLYYACMNFVTPPVALGALVAAGIAKAPYMKTAVESSKAAIGGFLVPFLFAFSPVFLLQAVPWLEGVVTLTGGLLLILSAQIAFTNYFLTHLSWGERALSALVAILWLVQLVGRVRSAAIAGMALFMLLFLMQWKKRGALRRSLEISVAVRCAADSQSDACC